MTHIILRVFMDGTVLHWLLLGLNGIDLAVIFVGACAIYLRRLAPKACNWRECLKLHAIQIGLLLVAGGSFGSLIAPTYWIESPPWWSVMARTGIALIALRAIKLSTMTYGRRITDLGPEPRQTAR